MVVVTEKGGQPRAVPFAGDEIIVGRAPGNNGVVLARDNIAERHCRIVLRDGKFIIVNFSPDGTYVNGKRLTSPQVLKESDKVYLGDFTLQVQRGEATTVPAPTPTRAATRAERARDPVLDDVDVLPPTRR
ncbi:MAG TPA: FHA domain-containing protein [Myxococcota bacterium]